MGGETNLQLLLRGMRPVLHIEPYGFISTADAPRLSLTGVFAVMHEDEGWTIVAPAAVLEPVGFTVAEQWAHITLQIHSSLQAVGLTAAFANALGDAGISANVVAANHHDHIFVPWQRRHDPILALQTLSSAN